MEKIDHSRRKFIKWLLYGGGVLAAFILGKVVGPSLGIYRPQSLEKGDFKNFRVVENNKELRLYNRMGDEIFVIEKDPSAGLSE